MEYRGIFGVLLLVADVWAIVNVLQSGANTERKVLWTVLVLLLPLAGFIGWWIWGPKTNQA
jgi:succinate dehydrogenase/fumarate reductase cytochrome b subunit